MGGLEQAPGRRRRRRRVHRGAGQGDQRDPPRGADPGQGRSRDRGEEVPGGAGRRPGGPGRGPLQGQRPRIQAHPVRLGAAVAGGRPGRTGPVSRGRSPRARGGPALALRRGGDGPVRPLRRPDPRDVRYQAGVLRPVRETDAHRPAIARRGRPMGGRLSARDPDLRGGPGPAIGLHHRDLAGQPRHHLGDPGDVGRHGGV